MKARDLIGNDTFLTINVDILTDLNIRYFLSAHQQENALISVAVTDRQTTRYLLFNKYNRLCGWRNTQTGAERISIEAKEYHQKAYSGVAIFQPEVFGLNELEGKFSLIDCYLALANEHKIAGFDHSESRLLDVGKPETVAIAEQTFA